MKKFLSKTTMIFLFLATMSGISESVEQQDCEVMNKKDFGLMLGWKFGGLGWGMGPEIGYKSVNGVDWKGSVQYMVAEYQELCSRYNTGRISKEHYEKEIQSIIERSRRYEKEIAEYFYQKKQRIFNEMKEYAR
jgi:hypothetical protein